MIKSLVPNYLRGLSWVNRRSHLHHVTFLERFLLYTVFSTKKKRNKTKTLHTVLTHSFSMHHFSTLWKHPKNLTVFWCFQGVEKGCTGNEWVNANSSELWALLLQNWNISLDIMTIFIQTDSTDCFHVISCTLNLLFTYCIFQGELKHGALGL